MYFCNFIFDIWAHIGYVLEISLGRGGAKAADKTLAGRGEMSGTLNQAGHSIFRAIKGASDR